jgi:hypothetical protein
MIWMGILLRVRGGDPSADSASNGTPSATQFASYRFECDDLCEWDADSVVLNESLSMPAGSKFSDSQSTLAWLTPLAMSDAIEKMRGIPSSQFEHWRRQGRKVDVLVVVRTPSSSIRLPLSPEFVAACQGFGLGIEVQTGESCDRATILTGAPESPGTAANGPRMEHPMLTCDFLSDYSAAATLIPPVPPENLAIDQGQQGCGQAARRENPPSGVP